MMDHTNMAGPPSEGLSSEPNPISEGLFPKRSRRSVQKRVVSVPIQEGDGSRAKGVSECSPPADSWAWRKYGQKPIKGSPYPRGYYRCSSSKGCPARKQVERSRVDPAMLVVTYTCEHNHTWPPPRSHHKQQQQQPHVTSVKEEADPDPDPTALSPPEYVADPDPDPEEPRFSDLIGEDSMMMPDEFWYSDVGSTSSTSPPSDTLLYGPIFSGSTELALEEMGDFKEDSNGDDDDDALFAGLGELPEYSTVFRRRLYSCSPITVHGV